MKNEKWTPNFIFHFASQMENRKWVSIFNFSVAVAQEFRPIDIFCCYT